MGPIDVALMKIMSP